MITYDRNLYKMHECALLPTVAWSSIFSFSAQGGSKFLVPIGPRSNSGYVRCIFLVEWNVENSNYDPKFAIRYKKKPPGPQLTRFNSERCVELHGRVSYVWYRRTNQSCSITRSSVVINMRLGKRSRAFESFGEGTRDESKRKGGGRVSALVRHELCDDVAWCHTVCEEKLFPHNVIDCCMRIMMRDVQCFLWKSSDIHIKPWECSAMSSMCAPFALQMNR